MEYSADDHSFFWDDLRLAIITLSISEKVFVIHPDPPLLESIAVA